jgi:16S rRNA C1402 (ribose-2'-O) methylase RsmI
VVRGKVGDVAAKFRDTKVRGEIVIVVSGQEAQGRRDD